MRRKLASLKIKLQLVEDKMESLMIEYNELENMAGGILDEIDILQDAIEYEKHKRPQK